MNDVLRFIHLLSFFIVAFVVAKKLYNRGIDQYGIIFRQGWKRHLGLGFLLGFIAWALLFLLYFILSKYTFTGVIIDRNTVFKVVAIILGYGFGSLISDMVVRGLVFNHFKDNVSPKYVFIIALIVYALDDIWYEGFDAQNTIFSLALGLGLTYAYYKTNAIWASAGMHFGLNMVYGLFFGVSGKSGDGVFSFIIQPNPPYLLSWLSTFISLLLFMFVYIMFHRSIK